MALEKTNEFLSDLLNCNDGYPFINRVIDLNSPAPFEVATFRADNKEGNVTFGLMFCDKGLIIFETDKDVRPNYKYYYEDVLTTQSLKDSEYILVNDKDRDLIWDKWFKM